MVDGNKAMENARMTRRSWLAMVAGLLGGAGAQGAAASPLSIQPPAGASATPPQAAPQSQGGGRPGVLPWTGVNLAGGEFYDPIKVRDPVYDKDFIYPGKTEFTWARRVGFNIVRIPFLWETLQREPMKPLDEKELKRLLDCVRAARRAELAVILDPHNYARYRGALVGGPDLPQDAFADFWGRLAPHFIDDDGVWLGLMNEPHGLPARQWLAQANAAILRIRQVGARNLILVPGVAWSGAWSWDETFYGESNAVAMLGVQDPISHFAIEVHQYFDADSAGKSDGVVSANIGVERLRNFTRWARSHGVKAFLGEFAVPATEPGKLAVQNMLEDMERNREVWLGFAWWAAGPWWQDYMFSIEPSEGPDKKLVEKPQLAFLQPFLQQPLPAPRAP